MNVDEPLPLLGGLTPAQFMRRHWQRKPLLVRGALPGFRSPVLRQRLFELARSDEVESRLVAQHGGWQFERGPFAKLPAASRAQWTLLVQGADLHEAAAHEVLRQFRFVPEARLDDLMISWASDGGGVGPHFDSYDVFLLQAQGRRRWRYGRQRDLTLRDDVPLKILREFEPEHDEVLEPGDMLYLPPRYAHDGIAVGECQTWSIGFRAPARGELARELLQRLADDVDDDAGELYRDAGQGATDAPGAIPTALREFAREAVERQLRDPVALERALGEYLTEPKANVWFEAQRVPRRLRAVSLDARTRMMHDERHIYVNGESWRAAGRDANLMRTLADRRALSAADLAKASEGAIELLKSWCEAGWLHAVEGAS